MKLVRKTRKALKHRKAMDRLDTRILGALKDGPRRRRELLDEVSEGMKAGRCVEHAKLRIACRLRELNHEGVLCLRGAFVTKEGAE